MTQKFQIGDRVIRAELEPFEVDLLVPKVRLAEGRVIRVFDCLPNRRYGRIKYEVLWTWPDGETCVAHYYELKLEHYTDAL